MIGAMIFNLLTALFCSFSAGVQMQRENLPLFIFQCILAFINCSVFWINYFNYKKNRY